MFNGDASVVPYAEEAETSGNRDDEFWSGNRPRDDIINASADNWWRTYSPLVALAVAMPLFALWGFLLYKLYKGEL